MEGIRKASLFKTSTPLQDVYRELLSLLICTGYGEPVALCKRCELEFDFRPAAIVKGLLRLICEMRRMRVLLR